MPKPWATTEQVAWLNKRIPDWHQARRDGRPGEWLGNTTSDFLDAFTQSGEVNIKKVSLPPLPPCE